MAKMKGVTAIERNDSVYWFRVCVAFGLTLTSERCQLNASPE